VTSHPTGRDNAHVLALLGTLDQGGMNRTHNHGFFRDVQLVSMGGERNL